MRLVRINKFLHEKHNVTWLIDGLLPDVGMTLFYGLPGVGKSTFAAQLCAALHTGSDFLGRKVQKTSIMFVQADSLVLEWKAMLARICPDSDGFTVVEVDERMLGNSKAIEWLAEQTEKYNPGYIVFDSLQKLTAWTISTDSGASMAMNAIRLITGDRPSMLIHHPPHAEFRASGHQSLTATPSNVWGLLKTKLKIDKGRLTPIKEILLSRDSNGLWCQKPIEDSIYDAIMDKPLWAQ